MAPDFDSSVLYKLAEGYQITKINSEPCNLIFRDNKAAVVAIIEACQGRMTRIEPYRGRSLTATEKHLLHKFIRNNQYQINSDVAVVLGLSILRRGDEPEEYLSERQLIKRLHTRMKDTHLFVGKLKMNTLRIPSFSKGCIYNLSHAKIKKLVIEKNCDLLLDMRDNMNIEALRVHESFTGSINMSRNTVESIEIGNNCRCDLAVYDSLRCFNLLIADVYSGNLNIKNSCFHAIEVGFYCYAVIKLSQNWGRRDISIGDSFRGSLTVDNVDVYSVKVGNDCKGQIAISGQDQQRGNREVKIAEDFAGILDLRGSQTVEEVQIGRHARGRVNLLGCPAVRVVRLGKYFSGYADFSESAVEYVQARYGCSGEMVFLNCDNLTMLQLPKDRNSQITIEREPVEVKNDNDNLYYRFSDQPLPANCYPPLYRQIYDGMRSLFSGEPV